MPTTPTDPIDRPRARRPRRAAPLLASCVLALAAPEVAWAAAGDVLFADDFEAGTTAWTWAQPDFAGTNEMTAASGRNALFLRGGRVEVTSERIDTRAPSVRIRAWIRRGDDRFSENPDRREDLDVSYLDADGSWIPLRRYAGEGTQGEIFALDEIVAGDALHGGFRLRFRLEQASGGPPENQGKGWDYWHVDDVEVAEAAPPVRLALGECEEFESGLGAWRAVDATHGRVVTGTQTAATPPRSLAINGGVVTARSPEIDLAGASNLDLSMWIRRGADAFSEDPDRNEDLYVEILDASGDWIQLARYVGDGTPGQIFTPSFALPESAAHAGFRIRLRMTGDDGVEWDYWHVDSVCLDGESEIAEWRFEERAWHGPGAVADTSGAHAGSATHDAITSIAGPAIDGNPGTCRYAVFDGQQDGIDVPHHDALNGTTARTLTAWIHPHDARHTRHVAGKQVTGPQRDRSQLGLFTSGRWLYGRAITQRGDENVRIPLPALDAWSHVALVFDASRLALYLDGRLQEERSFDATTLVEGERPFAIGHRPGSGDEGFDGFIDEVRVYGAPLSSAELIGVMQEAHECAAGTTVFRVDHDGAGVHCQAEAFSVSALDVDGLVRTDFEEEITLQTGTGRGTFGLVAGAGRFVDDVPDDGLARYVFDPADDGVARFTLEVSSGASSVDIDVVAQSGRDDDAEGPIVFAPSRFVLTESALADPAPTPLPTGFAAQTAGAAFDLHLTAFGTSGDDATCGVVEDYTGDQRLAFWLEHRDPARAPLSATVDDRAIGVGSGNAGTRSVRFAEGRARVRVRYKDVGEIALHVADGAAATPIVGATGAFVSKPADFAFVSILNVAGEANPGVSAPIGDAWGRAGEAFSVVVEARDAEGTPTPSFGRESVPEGLRLRSAALVAPAGGRNGAADDGAIGNATDFALDATPGRLAGDRFSFDEVGAIRLEASLADGDYLGAGDVTSAPSTIVGRFAPSRFEVTANVPRFRTTCGLGAFSWMGQPFTFAAGEAPVLEVRALSAAGTTTANYAGDWWRLDNDSLADRRYTIGTGHLDERRLPGTDADPTIRQRGDGTGTLTFSTGGGLAVERTTPEAPFDAEIALSIDVLDADGVALPDNPFVLGGTSPGAGIAFDVSKRFQFGRLALDNAHGSELTAMPLSLRTQVFDGDRFADDSSDQCTTLPLAALVATPLPERLSAPASIAFAPLRSGDAGLSLAAPNTTGTVDLEVRLDTAGLPWLRGDWPEDGLDGLYDDDPRAHVTFGIWDGRDELIFVQETY